MRLETAIVARDDGDVVVARELERRRPHGLRRVGDVPQHQPVDRVRIVPASSAPLDAGGRDVLDEPADRIDLTIAAGAVREGNLQAQAPVGGEDEVGQLGETFNEMTASLLSMTNDLRDAWFVGFTPELLTVVWVGLELLAQPGHVDIDGAVRRGVHAIPHLHRHPLPDQLRCRPDPVEPPPVAPTLF